MSTNTYIYIYGDSEVKLWGLSGRERLERMVQSFQHINLIDDPLKTPDDSPILLLRADHLFDIRVISTLIHLEGEIVLCNQAGTPVALRTVGNRVPSRIEALRHTTRLSAIHGMKQYSIQDLQVGLQQKLKKKSTLMSYQLQSIKRKRLNGSFLLALIKESPISSQNGYGLSLLSGLLIYAFAGK